MSWAPIHTLEREKKSHSCLVVGVRSSLFSGPRLWRAVAFLDFRGNRAECGFLMLRFLNAHNPLYTHHSVDHHCRQPPSRQGRHHPRPGIYNRCRKVRLRHRGHRLGIQNAPAGGGPLQITDYSSLYIHPLPRPSAVVVLSAQTTAGCCC